MREKSYRLALGGVLSAFSVALMFFGSVVPFATYAVPAIASLTVLFFAAEFSKGYALVIYAAVSALSALLAPDKEMAFLFAAFFGHYPILKGVYEGKCKSAVEWILKVLTFNVCVISFYFVVTRLFVISAVRDEFAEYTAPFLAVLLLLGNFTFVFYDLALSKLLTLYWNRLRKKLIKSR